jgi:4-hydroxybenzoate polyprenyltransferase
MLKLIRSIFFGNYFIGLIAIALSVESCVQLRLPLNSATYYIILFCATVFYYTYAYLGPLSTSKTMNPRKAWYIKNNTRIVWSQRILFITCVLLGCFFIYKNFDAIEKLPRDYWFAIIIMLLAGFFYYGLLPKSFYKINLRKTGWLKAFIIGFVWACCANILSFIAVQIETGTHTAEIILLIWLFIKNWMFCTVNAIIFDVKDYADDSNKQLKTFVVSFGLRKTIYFVLLPLIIIGLFSLIAFTTSRHAGFITIGFNLIPFILLLMIAWSMQKPHKILYYLVVIDGLIFLKAVCGIIGMQFINN